jgi:segregation and condensation protein A
MLPELKAWTPLDGVAPASRGEGPSRASCLASTLSAGLELVKEGRLEARQLAVFEDVYLRRRETAA